MLVNQLSIILIKKFGLVIVDLAILEKYHHKKIATVNIYHIISIQMIWYICKLILLEVVMKWLEIGTYTKGTLENQVVVKLHNGFEKALLKLDLFSHCNLYLLQKENIDMSVAKIIELKQSTGQIVLQIENQRFDVSTGQDYLTGQLVDIKPYFPSEEVIPNAPDKENKFIINYKNCSIGKYFLQGKKTVIQLDSEFIRKNPDSKKSLKGVKDGDFLRIMWYFHRFDKDSFRKNRTCNPPYNNAPKTGIFASRSPVRPNPLASTVVKVNNIDAENGVLEILGFDGFSDTEIFQIMYYQPYLDKVEGATIPSWVSHWTDYKSFEKPKEINIDKIGKVKKIDNINIADVYSDELDSQSLSDDDENDTDEINIHNAKIHNLKNVSVKIPKEKITLITGVSGSGKSSLAFDTLYAESQKQFMDLVMSNQMLSDTFSDGCVDKITGLQPSIAIAQRGLGANPRSTVGSVTRIADVMKLLFSAIGERLCPTCHDVVDSSNVCNECGEILFDRTPQLFSYNHPDYMCPVCKGLGQEMQIDETLIVENPEKSLLDKASSLYGDLRKHRKKPNANWIRGEILALADDMNVDLDKPFSKLPDEFKKQFFYGSNGREVSLKYENSKGRSGVITRPVEGAVNLIERLAHDTKSDRGLENVKRFMSKKICSRCNGERLLEEGRMVNILGYRYPEVMKLSIDNLIVWCHKIYKDLTNYEKDKSRILLSKILFRLKKIENVGLSYINMDRSIPSLSGGEAQRLKLATQFGTGLSNILYIMDEPSKGLHPKDYRFLMDALVDLKKHGNTVILVEHKKSFLTIADKHIQMGPKAGRYGGVVIAEKEGENINQSHEIEKALDYTIDISELKMSDNKTDLYIELYGVSTNNLKSVDVKIPKEKMTAVIGVSGSGKSSLISKTLYPHLLESLGKSVDDRGTYKESFGIESFTDVNYVNQKPIGSNSRSNPGTYTGVFDLIRKSYAKLKDAVSNKMGKEHFSFNSKKGQCTECNGLGEVAVNMHYMDDIMIPCNSCKSKRYNPEVLEIKRNGYSIGDILEMEISDLLEVFKDENEILQMLNMLVKVGLGYLKLGQSASSLSGGEAQRIKLAKELYRDNCKNVLYILDEPTTGLHEDDVDKVITVLKELKEKGATLIIIEHNIQMIKECEFIVELGPTGGDKGGEILRMGYQP